MTTDFAKITTDELQSPWSFFAYRACWVTMRLIQWVKFSIQAQGHQYIPKRRGAEHSFIIASNHTSNWDPPQLAMALGPRWPISFMAKRELFKHPVVAWLFHRIGTFSVNRQKMEKATLKSAKAVLAAKGWTLGIFPEGTRSEDGSVGSVKKGVAFFAKSSKRPVLPVGIARDAKQVRITFGPIVRLEEGEDLDAFGDRLQAVISELAVASQARL